MITIGIVTIKDLLDENLAVKKNSNVIHEETILKEVFALHDLRSERVAWDDVGVDWAKYDALILRSTWNYHEQAEKFKEWLDNIPQEVIITNGRNTIKWNLNKEYLIDLERKGIPIPNTKIIKRHSKTSLEKCFNSVTKSDDVVLKPVVAASGRNTHHIRRREIQNFENTFQNSLENEDMIVQEFVHSVLSKGEVSMVMINGAFTHATLKRARSGEFRVQSDFGGSVETYNPNKEELSFAKSVCASLDDLPLYARVDLVYNDDKPILSELELIEPELWFCRNIDSADLLVKSMIQKFFP